MTKAEDKEAECMFLLFGKMNSGFCWHGQSFYFNASHVHMVLASDLAVTSHSRSLGDITSLACYFKNLMTSIKRIFRTVVDIFE